MVLLFAATVSLDDGLVRSIDKARHERRGNVAPDFDLSPETGPRTAFIVPDPDGHRKIWDLTLSSP